VRGEEEREVEGGGVERKKQKFYKTEKIIAS